MAALALLAVPAVCAAPLLLDPQFAGTYASGSGANARFVQVDGQWRGSTVLWNEATQTFGSGEQIGSFAWGTGLWGRADWQAAIDSANGATGSAYPRVVRSWSGVAASINFGNALYNDVYSGLWGPAALLPLFDPTMAYGEQENWLAHFTGYIRVTDAGIYNFSVLNDDGFFFRLIGAGDAALEIARDYLNPRDRNGFDVDLLLGEGLYGFELGMWNRLEAGVVDLRWSLDGGQTWTLVPTTSLLASAAVPAPGSLLLASISLAALALLRRVPAETV